MNDLTMNKIRKELTNDQALNLAMDAIDAVVFNLLDNNNVALANQLETIIDQVYKIKYNNFMVKTA